LRIVADQARCHLGAADVDGQAALHRATLTVEPGDEGPSRVSRLVGR
jgi:hypothetical protein